MNVLIATGNIGRDAEVRYTPAGKAVVSFSVAMKAGYGDREKTIWLNCSMWGDRGVAVAPYLLKGVMVAVSGEMSTREYEKDGQMKTTVDLKVNDLTLCGSKSDAAPAQSKASPSAEPAGFEDTDIPF